MRLTQEFAIALVQGDRMLTLVVVLVLLWFLGFMTRYTLGGLLHILLIVAIVIGLVNFIQRRT
jgi:hypothetical protein